MIPGVSVGADQLDQVVKLIARVARYGSYPAARVWYEVWSTKPGGGGELDLQPDALLVVGKDAAYDSLALDPAQATFRLTENIPYPVIQGGAVYALIFKSDAPRDGVAGVNLDVFSSFNGDNISSGVQDGAGIAFGRPRGFEMGNYFDGGNMPLTVGAGIAWSLPNMAAGVVSSSPDLQTLVLAALERAGPDRKICLWLDGLSYGPDGDLFYPNLAGENVGLYIAPTLVIEHDPLDPVCLRMDQDLIPAVDLEVDLVESVALAVDVVPAVDLELDLVPAVAYELDVIPSVDLELEVCLGEET